MDRFDPWDLPTDKRPIILSSYPSAALLANIARGRVRVLFLLEPPHRTLRFMQAHLGVPAIEAIRSQTASAVANLAVAASPSAKILRRDSERSVRDVVRLICDHFRLNVSHAAFEEIVASSAGPAGPGAQLDDVLPQDGATSDDTLDTACQLIVEPALRFAEGETLRPIVWPTEVFTFHDQPEAPPPPIPSIAGPSRNLYYGPYFYLPPATYRVEANLVFSRDFPDVPFVIEVHTEAWLAKARISERLAGRYRGYFHLHHTDPTAAIEIRLRNESPVANGHLSLVELLFFVQRQLAV